MDFRNTVKKIMPLDSPLDRVLRKVFVRIPYLIRSRIDAKRSSRALAAFAETSKDVYFVQIGANDGSSLDPLYQVAKAHGWSGLLVEPARSSFEKLSASYAGRAGISLENCAISDREETRDFYSIPGHSKLSSFLPQVVEKAAASLGIPKERIEKHQVSCLPPQTLFDKHGLRKIDVLLVDTEGYDFEILKKIDFTRYRPGILMYEEGHLSRPERNACRKMIRGLGYDLLVYWGDVMGIKR